LSVFGRPRLYGEASARLEVCLPASVAQRVRDLGLQSKQIATVLEDFLNDDAHLGLVQKTTALGDAWNQDRRRLEEAIRKGNALKHQLVDARRNLANEHRAITQLVRNAPAGERRGLIQTLHTMKKHRGDLDVDLHAIEDLLHRAARAHMAVAA